MSVPVARQGSFEPSAATLKKLATRLKAYILTYERTTISLGLFFEAFELGFEVLGLGFKVLVLGFAVLEIHAGKSRNSRGNAVRKIPCTARG